MENSRAKEEILLGGYCHSTGRHGVDPVQRLTVADNKTGLDLKSRNILKVDQWDRLVLGECRVHKKRENKHASKVFSLRNRAKVMV